MEKYEQARMMRDFEVSVYREAIVKAFGGK